jgi:hypothetical protein
MKYWDSGLNAPGSRRFRTTVHIAAQLWLIEGVQEKKGQAKLNLAPNLLLNWVSYPVEVQCTFFFPVFWNLVPYVTKQGVPVPSFPDFTDNMLLWWKWWVDILCVGHTLYLRACTAAQKLGALFFKLVGGGAYNLAVEEMSPATTPRALHSRAYFLKSFILASLFRMHLESEVSHILPSPIVSMLK